MIRDFMIGLTDLENKSVDPITDTKHLYYPDNINSTIYITSLDATNNFRRLLVDIGKENVVDNSDKIRSIFDKIIEIIKTTWARIQKVFVEMKENIIKEIPQRQARVMKHKDAIKEFSKSFDIYGYIFTNLENPVCDYSKLISSMDILFSNSSYQAYIIDFYNDTLKIDMSEVNGYFDNGYGKELFSKIKGDILGTDPIEWSIIDDKFYGELYKYFRNGNSMATNIKVDKEDLLNYLDEYCNFNILEKMINNLFNQYNKIYAECINKTEEIYERVKRINCDNSEAYSYITGIISLLVGIYQNISSIALESLLVQKIAINGLYEQCEDILNKLLTSNSKETISYLDSLEII